MSIFSPDQQTDESDPDSGARGFLGFCRPYAPTVCGSRVSSMFAPKTGVFVLRYFPKPENFVVGKMLSCTIIFLPDVQFSNVFLELPTDIEVRSPRPGAGYHGAVLSSQRRLAFHVEIYRGTYVMHKLPGRHILYVWALQSSQLFGALEPVEVRVLRTGAPEPNMCC